MMDFAVESREETLANLQCRKYQPSGASVRHCGANGKATNPQIASDSPGVHGPTPFHFDGRKRGVPAGYGEVALTR